MNARAIPALVEMTRPVNAVMMGIAVAVGFVLSGGGAAMLPSLLAGMAAASFLIAFANASNDIIDIHTDRVNQPTRPLPSGRVSLAQARNFSLLLMLFGLMFSVLTFNVPYILVSFMAMFLSTLYNVKLKKTGLAGNALVSALVALPFLAGSLVATSPLSAYILIFAVSAFFGNMGREVHKGVTDVKGDSSGDIETFAVKHGEEAARRLAAALYVVAVIFTFLPGVIAMTNQLYIYAVAIPDAMVLVSTISILTTSDTEALRKDKDLVRLAMVFIMLSFVVGSIRF